MPQFLYIMIIKTSRHKHTLIYRLKFYDHVKMHAAYWGVGWGGRGLSLIFFLLSWLCEDHGP